MTKKKITDNSVLGIIYMLVLAAAITLFVGITLNTFYPAPTYPESKQIEVKESAEMTAEQKATEKENQNLQDKYEESMKDWAEVSSIVVIIAATLLVILGLFLAGKMPVLPNGVLLGGLSTIFMSVIFSAMSESRYLIFGVVTASLVVIVTAGYLRFVHFEKK